MNRLVRAIMNLGVVAVVLGLGKVHARWVADPPYDLTQSGRFGWSLGYICVLMVVAYGMGLPDLVRSRPARVSAALGAGLISAAVVSVVQLVVGDAQLPRFVVLGSALLLIDWFSLCAKLAQRDREVAGDRDRVVLVVGGDSARVLVDELERAAERPAVVVATLEPSEAVSIADRRPMESALAATQATVVVLDRAAQLDPSIIAQAGRLHEQGVRVRTLSLFYEEWLGKLPMSELERVSLMFDIGEVHRARYGRFKRILDVAVGAAGLVALVAAVPVVALANLMGNRGPLLYRQDRVGRGGQVFRILKFRSMLPDPTAAPGAGGSRWTSADDERITRFGGFLRRSHLDELPQVVNILRGDLSIVGPRPEQPHYVAELSEKLPFYNLRHLVRPGLTGWAQVKYPYGADEADALEKLQYEFFYMRHQSPSLDLRILGRTVRSLMGLNGR